MISTRNRPLLLGAPLLPAFPSLFHQPSHAVWASQDATAVPGYGTVSTLVAGNSKFAFDLYHELARDTASNLVFSPYSISLALVMTYAGAHGETAAQMAEALSFMVTGPKLHSLFNDLNEDLMQRGNAEDDPNTLVTGRTLRIANALWGEQTYPFSETFSTQIEEPYGAGLQPVDFINASDTVRDEINDWVDEQTEGRIRDIVSEGDLNPDTRLVLANAILFHAAWYRQFSPDQTHDDTFTLFDGTTVIVPFMFQHDHFDYAQADGFQVVDLPYAGSGSNPGDFTFTALLPDEGTFDTFSRRLDADMLDTALRQLDWTEALVNLPRFAFTSSASLTDGLQALGMIDAFDPEKADLSGMLDGGQPPPLWLDKVLHKAFIGVDEDGTEAGAATVIVGPGAPPPMEEPPEIHFNRPFLFAIRDRMTGSILFLGRVMDPRG